MITMSLALIFGAVALVVFLVAVLLFGLPMMIILSLAPWVLSVLGIVLLVKALFEKPVRVENFMPAIIAFAISAVLRWIF